ncbi:MAG: hypothetical protein KAG61_06245 [Bacteriovoracaceae bacterium]|nr:hypothetical protein [Bacteriovoracaceae bacterium]
MIEIGKVNNLIFFRENTSGFYLRDDESGEEVFMPPAMAPVKMEHGKAIDVFVYLDTTGSKIATSQVPFACVGEYAVLEAINVQDFGAFFDWGIEKDLLVPGNEQKIKVRRYETYVVRICLEEGTDRIFGTTKLGQFIESSEFDIAEGDTVPIIVAQETDLGFRVVVNKKFIGMIYHSEIYSKIRIGKQCNAVVTKLREDGLVDLSLQAVGVQNLLDSKGKVLEMLEKRGGKSPLHDKSSPDAIKRALGMSKKSFKSAIGMLYKDKKIIITKEGIELDQKD